MYGQFPFPFTPLLTYPFTRRLSVFYTVTLHVVAEAMRRADGAIAGEVAITSPVAAQRRSPEEAHTRARGRVRRQNGAQGGTDQLSAAPS